MGLLGLNFGLSKNKSKSASTIDKTETTSQDKLESTEGTTATTNSQTGSQSSTGSSTSSQTTEQTGVKTNTGVGTSSLFSDPVLQGLEETVLKGLGLGAPQGVSRTFDKDGYVNSTMSAAEANSRDILDIAGGSIADMTGSRIGNSSMGTLLLDQVQRGQTANLAGIRGQAETTAAGIQNTMDQLTLASNQQGTDWLTGILQQLKGGQSTTSQTGAETNATTGSGTATTNTAEQQTSQSDSTSLQTISQLVSALLSGTTNTKGTETTKGSSTA